MTTTAPCRVVPDPRPRPEPVPLVVHVAFYACCLAMGAAGALVALVLHRRVQQKGSSPDGG